MGQACEVCGKKPMSGNQVTTRGKAKYLGGVGTKVTGCSHRRFKPNLQRVKIHAGSNNRTVRVCTQCLRSGAVLKAQRAKPFRLPTGVATEGAGASG